MIKRASVLVLFAGCHPMAATTATPPNLVTPKIEFADGTTATGACQDGSSFTVSLRDAVCEIVHDARGQVAAGACQRGDEGQEDFNTMETWGVDDIMPMEQYLFALERHRIYALANALNGGYAKELAQATSDADAAEKHADEVNDTKTPKGTYAELFKLHKEAHEGAGDTWDAAKAAWAKAKAMQPGKDKPEDIDTANAAAVNAVAGVIQNQPGQFSNLILDPDLDSYWLMDGFLYKYADLGTHAIELAAATLLAPHGVDMETGQPVATDKDKMFDVVGIIGSLLSEQSVMESMDLGIAFREVMNYSKDEKLVPTLKPLAAGTRTALENLMKLVKSSYLVPAKPAVDAAKLVDATAAVLTAIHGIWMATGPSLRGMAQRRVDMYKVPHRASAVCDVHGATCGPTSGEGQCTTKPAAK
jgi:hypothetical protein